MNEDQILERIISCCEQVGEKKQLQCVRAFELSEELGIDVKVIGRLCNRLNIKVKNCQMGCF